MPPSGPFARIKVRSSLTLAGSVVSPRSTMGRGVRRVHARVGGKRAEFLISARTRPLQADPEELPHPRAGRLKAAASRVMSSNPRRSQVTYRWCSGPARRYGGDRRGRSHSVEAQWAAPGHRKIEKDETVDDCQLPAVEQREETSRPVRHEIGDRHVPREDKGDGAGEEAQREQQTAYQLQ